MKSSTRRGMLGALAAFCAFALVAYALVGATAAPARADTSTDPVNPGGNLVVSMPFGGVSTSEMSSILSSAFPQAIGASSSSVNDLTQAMYSMTEASGSGAAPPPTICPASTVTVTATPTATVTVTVPASCVPASNAPGGPRGALAAAISGVTQVAVGAVGYGVCYAWAGFRNRSNIVTDAQNQWCKGFGGFAAIVTAYSLNDEWGGLIPQGKEWSKIFTFAVTSATLLAAQDKWFSPWVEENWAAWGLNLNTWMGEMIENYAPWLGTGAAAIRSFITSMFVSQATPTTMAQAFQSNGMVYPVQEGAIDDPEIKNGQDYCVDDYGAQGTSFNGQKVAINTCNGGQDQYWEIWSNGSISNSGMCLDITGASWSGETPLEAYQCNGQWNQVWAQYTTIFGHPEVQNPRSGLCVDDPDWNTDPGTQLQDQFCNAETAQRWRLPGYVTVAGNYPLVTDYGPIDSGLSGKCMDAYGSNNGASPRQMVAINDCNGNPAQDWTVWSDGSIRVWNLCLDTDGGTSAFGTPLLDLENCNGGASQTWSQQSNGSLVNSATGMCLDDPNSSTTDGTQLQIYNCNGSPAQQWTLPGAPPGEGPPPPPPGGSSVCDLYSQYGSPCVAAYSMTRAMYSSYNGALYQVQRASDGATADIGLLAAGGDVNASEQDSFCSGTTCTVTKIYDQSPDGNNLTIEGAGGAAGQDHGANATALPITIGGNKAYGLDVEPGVGYRDNSTTAVATGSAPEGMYMVASGTHVNSGCCFDFGNAETNTHDNGAGHMDAVNLTTWCGSNSAPCTGGGPWVEADMENGQWMGSGSNPGEQPNGSSFVTAMLKNDGSSKFELEGGDSTSGGLSTWYNGGLPPGYSPMSKEGAIVLGTGGDNSNSDVGSWFEGVMTSGYPSDAADAAVQANIVAAGYSGNTNPPSSSSANVVASAAGQAVVHSAGATGAGASGFSSVYTVDSSNGHLQESYLPYMGDAWTTQDLSTQFGTPPVMPGTQPVSIVHCGWTSVYTVDADNGDLQETYLPGIGTGWSTQDLSKNYGTPPTNQTPTAVEHYAGASGASPGCGFTSVYTRDRNGDLQETYLPNAGFPGDPWTTQDLSTNYGTPQILAGTSPVALTHCGFTSVYTVDAASHHLQETYLPQITNAWNTQDLSVNYGTPPTTTTPTAVEHYAGATDTSDNCGFTSVYTVDQGSQDLQETYLPSAGFPGDPWTTQDLSANYGTPPVASGTQPEALVHMNFTSVYTIDRGTDHLQETYLPTIGGAWNTQDLTINYAAPTTDQSPIVLLHPDASGNFDWASVFTIGEFSDDLEETYLPNTGFPGDGWITQDLSHNYGTPVVYVQQSSQSSWSVDHDGYTSVYTVDSGSNDLQETYLTAMGASWNTQNLSTNYGTPSVAANAAPSALFHDGYTSVFTVDGSNHDLQETYLPGQGFPGDAWNTQDLSAHYGTPQVAKNTSPSSLFHDGNASVFTIDANGDLQETYVPGQGFPGDPWNTQDLSVNYGTPKVMAGTCPVAIYHDGDTSVFTIDAGSGDLQETYLLTMGGPWITQDLTANYGTPTSSTSPTAVFHDGVTSVFTADNDHDLQETYLPAMGDSWVTQDLTGNYGVPRVQTGVTLAPVALYHTGYTSVYYTDYATSDMVEAYLPALGGPWNSQDLTNNYGAPPPGQTVSPLVHYAANGGLTWTSIYSVDASNSHLQETYLPNTGFPGDSWITQDLSSIAGTPGV